MKKVFENARVTVEVPGEEGEPRLLLYRVEDLEKALEDLHFGQAGRIAAAVTRSLVPYDGAYSEEELIRAYQNLRGPLGADGKSGEKWVKDLITQAHENRLRRSHGI